MTYEKASISDQTAEVTGPKQNCKFISRLIDMLVDPNVFNVISWSEDGSMIVIKEYCEFVSEVLPLYFKHNSMPNFVRQLNMYNFKKVRKPIENTSVISYMNPLFVRDDVSLLPMISRKCSGQCQIRQKTMIEASVKGNSLLELNNVKDTDTAGLAFGLPLEAADYPQLINHMKKKLTLMEDKIHRVEQVSRSLLTKKEAIISQIQTTSNYINTLESIVVFLVQKLKYSEGLVCTQSSNNINNESLFSLEPKSLNSSFKASIVESQKLISSSYINEELNSTLKLLRKRRLICQDTKDNSQQPLKKSDQVSFKYNHQKTLNNDSNFQAHFFGNEYLFSQEVIEDLKYESSLNNLDCSLDMQDLAFYFHNGRKESLASNTEILNLRELDGEY